MIIRTYQHGDEDGIARLINESFDTFREWGLTPEKWLLYQDIDPGFNRSMAFVAEEDGKIVSHVQVIRRDVNFGKFIPVSGIANVCTDPSYRSRGLATQLLKEALSNASKWSSISALDTTYASGAHRLYRGLGYSPFHRSSEGDLAGSEVRCFCNVAYDPTCTRYPDRYGRT